MNLNERTFRHFQLLAVTMTDRQHHKNDVRYLDNDKNEIKFIVEILNEEMNKSREEINVMRNELYPVDATINIFSERNSYLSLRL